MTKPTVSKHGRRVVSHPDSSQCHQADLTMSQYYSMHAHIIQDNGNIKKQMNLTQEIYLSTVSEPCDIEQTLVDQTCELLKELCNNRKLHKTTTREQFEQYFLLHLTKS